VPRALLSVFDKTGVVDFARALHDLGWELLSSGGTAKVIADAGIPVIDVATVTGYPAILGHRVVTLHPSLTRLPTTTAVRPYLPHTLRV